MRCGQDCPGFVRSNERAVVYLVGMAEEAGAKRFDCAMLSWSRSNDEKKNKLQLS